MRWILSFLLLMGLGFSLYVLITPDQTDIKLKEANEYYARGVAAKTIYERKTYLNEALTLYSELEQKMNPSLGNGNLYRQIGNIYYELESYPFALLNYYRAKKLDPRDSLVYESIVRTREKLFLPKENGPTVFQNLFFIYHYYPLPKRLQLLFIFGLGAIILGSGAYWFRQRWMLWTAITFSVFCSVFATGALFTRYVEPAEGVLVKATLLKRVANEEGEWATKLPTPSGTKVTVVDILEEGVWLKVTTPDGTLGFIPTERIRII